MGEALVTALTATASSMTTAIGDILPVALPVMGGIMVITIGIRIFRKVAK